MMHKDSEVLEFIRNRLIYQYNENPLLDHMQNLDRIIRQRKAKENEG
jgi:hypothetical protein